jgi:ABC-type Zn uptake system ZnuABC Zn-binding protein ZnuA
MKFVHRQRYSRPIIIIQDPRKSRFGPTIIMKVGKPSRMSKGCVFSAICGNNALSVFQQGIMKSICGILIILAMLLSACRPLTSQRTGLPRVLAVESFLADIAQNVAGERLVVESLIPVNADPHAYQPSPQDATKVASADVIIINGANLEAFITPLLQNAERNQRILLASAGLTFRPDPLGKNPEGDPHFWLDPNNVIKYVQNIQDGLSQVDPAGSSVYSANAERYIGDLQNLDGWIKAKVQLIPATRRLLVTNHETFGYFAERYGFTLVGAIVPSITSGAAPSAQELAALINQINSSGAPAIFLETGANPQLADQIASETGVKVVTDLYTHSLSTPDGPAATYIDMMKYNVSAIVEALK